MDADRVSIILARRASLGRLTLLSLWGGYSTTIGHIAFSLPDACASAAEMGRRGIARRLKTKNLFPVRDDEVVARLWKDRPLPNVAENLRTASA